MLEVCIDSLESALNAVIGGADELEVCSSLAEGGLTPSIGLVKRILFKLNDTAYVTTKRPKINVMIRCRGGSDFCYNDHEMETMLEDIEMFVALGVDRIVFGALTKQQEIDEEKCEKVIKAAKSIPVTYHRAFDLCKDPIESLSRLISLGFSRVLTSGQKSSAANPEAIELIRRLQNLKGDKIQIMPGAGITCDNVRKFIEMGCEIVHSSCKVVRHLSKTVVVTMGSGDNEYVYIADEEIVRKMKDIIRTE